MNKLFFLVLSLFSLHSLQAFWPFSSKNQTTPAQTINSNAEQGDAIAQDVNRLINRITQLEEERNRIEADSAINTLRYINEMQQKEDIIQQKDTENAQLKKQVEFFATAYIVLCQTFKKNAISIGFNKAFKVLKNRLVDLDNSPEISTDMEIAAENLNNAMEQTLSPFYNEFKSAHDKEIKNNLTAAILKQKNSEHQEIKTR